MLSDMETRSISSPRDPSPAQVDAALAVADASVAAEEPQLAPGDVVGRYTVLSLVGGLIGLASGRFSLGQIAIPVGVGIGVGTGVPIVTSVVTAVI